VKEDRCPYTSIGQRGTSGTAEDYQCRLEAGHDGAHDNGAWQWTTTTEATR
jgi:hypothetical protein